MGLEAPFVDPTDGISTHRSFTDLGRAQKSDYFDNTPTVTSTIHPCNFTNGCEEPK